MSNRRSVINETIRRLYSEGVNPTIRLIRSICGGSPNTISELLREWRLLSGVEAPSTGTTGVVPWNKNLTKEDDQRLARPGNGSNFLKDGKPWNAGVKGYQLNSRGRPLTDERKESLRGYKPGRFIGERHWKWSGGRGRRHWRGSDWAAVKKMILARDVVCLMCRKEYDEWNVDGQVKRKSLSVHHIVPWPIGNNDHLNLATLCISCHMLVESNEDENQKLKDQVHQKYRSS